MNYKQELRQLEKRIKSTEDLLKLLKRQATLISAYLDLEKTEPNYSLRVKKGWETRRKNAQDAELQAKKDAFPQ